MDMFSVNSRHIKVCVVGEGGAGKSALVIQFLQSYFAQDYDPTIEDTYSKQIVVGGQPVILDILDTAGQDEYSSLREAQIGSTEALIICYRIDYRESLNSIYSIHQHTIRTRGELPPIILVGTMSDLESNRQISYAEGSNIAKKLGFRQFFETSSKLGTNISQVFDSAAKEVLIARKNSLNPAKQRTNTVTHRSSHASSTMNVTRTSPVQPQPQSFSASQQLSNSSIRQSSDVRRISRVASRTSSPLTATSQRVIARTYQNQPPERTRTPKPIQKDGKSGQKDPNGCCIIV